LHRIVVLDGRLVRDFMRLARRSRGGRRGRRRCTSIGAHKCASSVATVFTRFDTG
jgi:hypothetical protein